MTVSTSGQGEQPLRFEATVHPVMSGVRDVAGDVADFDLDRVPDPEGGVRLLIDQAEIARLVAAGFEVRLRRALAVQPLDPALIADDDGVRAWFDERTRAVLRHGSDQGES